MNRTVTAETKAAQALGRWHMRQRRVRAQTNDRKRTSRFGWCDNIVGVGVGRKYANGRKTRAASVTFFVKRKLAIGRLLKRERIPTTLTLDANAGEPVTTDIVEVGGAPSLHAGIVDPLRPGASLGHWRGVHGTLGIIVRKDQGPDLFILSCSHVLALSGEAQVGDPIEQPLIFDENPDRVVARLAKGFSVLSPTGLNLEDAALARIDNGIQTNAVPLPSQQAPTQVSSLKAGEFEPGTLTTLLGAETPGALGRVIAAASTWWLNGMSFGGLVAYRTSCRSGDSGAAVVSEDGTTLLGLHVGGNSGTRFGLFFPAATVFDRLGISLA